MDVLLYSMIRKRNPVRGKGLISLRKSVTSGTTQSFDPITPLSEPDVPLEFTSHNKRPVMMHHISPEFYTHDIHNGHKKRKGQRRKSESSMQTLLNIDTDTDNKISFHSLADFRILNNRKRKTIDEIINEQITPITPIDE